MLDLHSRRVVGWSVSDSNETETELALDRNGDCWTTPSPMDVVAPSLVAYRS
jgi:hypothetical protein